MLRMRFDREEDFDDFSENESIRWQIRTERATHLIVLDVTIALNTV